MEDARRRHGRQTPCWRNRCPAPSWEPTKSTPGSRRDSRPSSSCKKFFAILPLVLSYISIVPLWYLEGISTPASGTVPSTLPLLRTLQSAAYAKNTVSAPEQRLVCGIAVLTDRPASPAVNHPVLPYLGYSLWGSRQTSQANRRKLSRLSCIVQTKVIR